MNDLDEIKNELSAIKGRNVRVASDKAWEVSWTRRISIMILTYVIASIWLLVIKENHIYLKAVVPTLGYLLSTLSIPVIKKIWLSAKRTEQ
ncbi:MAG: hypothetical protein NTZ38_01025 [Candidatus Taylorbacteria bacterium]|nr:hypothetical protein [Candidatus Taylorbacteria bacterium]